jgi:GTPase involved in cell partitioning and DNA repair
MKNDIMVNEFEYSEIESLKRLIKKYAKVIDKQQALIVNLQDRLESKEEESYDRDGMIEKLEEAQALLSDVYHEAIEAGLTDIEGLMSAADSCVNEALDALNADN